MEDVDQSRVIIATAGRIAALNPFKIGYDFEIFQERLEQYLFANAIEESRKVTVLITSLTEEVYKILTRLVENCVQNLKTGMLKATRIIKIGMYHLKLYCKDIYFNTQVM